MNELTTRSLEEEIGKLKEEVAALTALQAKKDRLQQDYENSQLRFKAVFEQSPYGNKLINADLEIIKVNKALIKLLGYSEKELLGRRITDIAHTDFAKHWKALQIKLWAANKACFCIDTCLIKKDKTVIWCRITSILLAENGETLGYTILENISGRKAAEQNLKDANSRELLLQKKLLEATINAQENERLLVAEDVHNSLAQSLYGVKLSLNQINLEKLEHKPENDLAIENAKDVLSDCIKECRRISYNLTPSILEQFGLKAAIEDMCKAVKDTVDFKCYFVGLHGKLPKLLEVTIYRIAQELTTNVVKHAKAKEASIKLSINKKNIIIKVEDDGIGFDVSKIKDTCIGIRSVENKIHLLNGKIDFVSKPDSGTSITVRFSSSSL
jgi:PAS domain S-box-containing protein